MLNRKEKDIENEILAYLFSKRIFAWKNDSVGIFDSKKQVFRKNNNRFRINGVSDILGIYKGKPLAIEVKSQNGKPTEHQTEFLQRVANEGGIAIIARSIEDVEKALELT